HLIMSLSELCDDDISIACLIASHRGSPGGRRAILLLALLRHRHRGIVIARCLEIRPQDLRPVAAARPDLYHRHGRLQPEKRELFDRVPVTIAADELLTAARVGHRMLEGRIRCCCRAQTTRGKTQERQQKKSCAHGTLREPDPAGGAILTRAPGGQTGPFTGSMRRSNRALTSPEAPMKNLLVTALVLGVVTAPGAVRADQPPIIDRNLFFGEITIGGAQISPDGKTLSFLKPFKGTRNIWVKKAAEPFSAARPVSAETARPVRVYFWSRDSKYLLYVQDVGGDENFNVYAIDPSLPADPKTGVPPTRALTNLKGVRTELFAAPKAKPDILYIGLNDRDAHWHDLYELHISTGQRTLLRKNTEQIAGWDFDNDGNLRLAERTNSAGDTEILRVDPDGFKQIYSCTVLESCGVASFDASNKNVRLITNKGSLDLAELDSMDPQTGATTKVE